MLAIIGSDYGKIVAPIFGDGKLAVVKVNDQ
jgi:hypothetical protein